MLETLFFQKKKIAAAFCILLVLALGIVGHRRYEEKEKVIQEQEEAARKVREEQERRRQKEEETTAQAQKIRQAFDAASTEEAVSVDLGLAAEAARQAQADIKAFKETHAQDEKGSAKEAYRILDETYEETETILQMERAQDLLSQLYQEEDGAVVMNTAKTDGIFRDVQGLIWQIPEKYAEKQKACQKVVDRVSKAWDYVNDQWHYETSTLKVSVEEKKTSYTRYWVCHVQTFSPAQLCSALCGGTYGEPRATTSQEMAAHNGVVGVNGSGFSYSSGKPAPGKTMIKDGKVYEDARSNGNIMCVTGDGGMFTAAAGMTTKRLLKRNVKDTYCFGPTLVEGGQRYPLSLGDFRQTYRYQRTAVGMVSPGEYYLVVVQGKDAGGSQGMTYEELQQVFLDLGCTYAYNLDGGGSTTLVFKGKVINTLTDAAGERPCGDILYFIDAGDGGEGEEIIIHEDEAMLLPPAGS